MSTLWPRNRPLNQPPHAGRFEVRTGVADYEHAYTSTKFTAKGVDWIAGEWARHQLRVEVAA